MAAEQSPAAIDFERMSPEVVRGVPAPKTVNWDALMIAVDNSVEAGEGRISPLKRARLRKKVAKQVRETGLAGMDHRLRYNYCRARLTMGDFSDYWGWEFRDSASGGEAWAAHLYWEETWLAKWGGGGCNRLLVLGEQGVGDAIFIASVLPEALTRCREVIFECDDRLHTLLERSLPGLKCRPERPFEDRRSDYGQIDAFIPSFELLRMFRRSRLAFPGLAYLKPAPERVEQMKKYRGRTGVAWKGRQGAIDPMSLELAHPLSLQYKEFHRDIERAEVDLWSDLEGVVALASVLERVVTVPQSVHHMAGAQGLRVDLIVPEIRNDEALNLSPWDYSSAYGGKLPWYANAHVFSDVTDWKRRGK